MRVLIEAMTTYRTSDLAKAHGISVQLVRNYEAAGVLPPAERSGSGYRRYTAMHLTALGVTRLLLTACGGQPTQAVMQAVHRGDLGTALAQIDARQAALHQSRQQLSQTAAALQQLTRHRLTRPAIPREQRLRIGAAASFVGVRVSTVRFWEQQGLLQPDRDRDSNYREYGTRQLARLQVIALLRRSHYSFPAIQDTLEALETAAPHTALAALEQRRHAATATGWQLLTAISALQHYIATFHRHLIPAQ